MSAITYNCVRLCGRRLSVLRGAASTAICSRHTLFQPPRAPSRWLGTSPYLTTDLAEAEVNARGSGYKEIAVTQEGTVLTILLNRPKTFNAYNYHMFDEVRDALIQAGKDDSITVALITGAGKYFSSGKDLSDLKNPRDVGPEEEFVSTFLNFPKVLVAAVNGPAIGVGVTSLGPCDFIYAADTATFQVPFTSVGICPDFASSVVFPQIMGPSKANELLLLGRKFTAQQAYESNLVAQVFPADQFQEKVKEIVSKLVKLPPQALLKSKQLLRDVQRKELEEANITEIKVFIERMASDECKNAIQKYLQLTKKT